MAFLSFSVLRSSGQDARHLTERGLESIASDSELLASATQWTAHCMLHDVAEGGIDPRLSGGALGDLVQVVLLEQSFHGANLAMPQVEGGDRALLRL